MKGILILFAAALALPTLANSEPMEYALDMGHSRVFFDVNHQGYSTMRGMFRNFDGRLQYDADDPSASSVNMTIDAASVDMYHDGLNDHLKTSDFFDVGTHPGMTFASTEVEDLGDGQLRIHGDLTILDKPTRSHSMRRTIKWAKSAAALPRWDSALAAISTEPSTA